MGIMGIGDFGSTLLAGWDGRNVRGGGTGRREPVEPGGSIGFLAVGRESERAREPSAPPQ